MQNAGCRILHLEAFFIFIDTVFTGAESVIGLQFCCNICHESSQQTDENSTALVTVAAGRGRGASPGGTFQGTAFEGRKFGILAFALQCVSISLY